MNKLKAVVSTTALLLAACSNPRSTLMPVTGMSESERVAADAQVFLAQKELSREDRIELNRYIVKHKGTSGPVVATIGGAIDSQKTEDAQDAQMAAAVAQKAVADEQKAALDAQKAADDEKKLVETQKADEAKKAADALMLRVPVFDSRAFCAKLAIEAGGSNLIEVSCRQLQADAYRHLASESISLKTMSHCSSIGRMAGESYQIMQACVEQENEAALQL